MIRGLLLRRGLAEAIGTFFLVLIGTGAVMADAISGGAVGHVGVSLTFGFVVMGMIYAIGHISGAHINPAVTLGFWSVGLVVAFDALMGGLLTGASMNPARSLGPAAVGGVWTAHWIYWIAPMAAMVLAAHTYEFLRSGEAPAVGDPVA